MARKRAEDWKAQAGSWLGDAAVEQGQGKPALSADPARPMAGAFYTDKPPIIASEKSRTSSGRLLRRTLYFTPDEWQAILAAADADTRSTGERVTAAEIVRRAVRGWLDIGGADT